MKESFIKDYLDQAIIRIDFLTPNLIPSDSLSTELIQEIMKLFPIAEPREAIAEEFQIKGGQPIETKIEKMIEWNFYGKDKEKRLCLSKQSFFIAFKKYDSFKNLKLTFIPIAEKLFKNYTGLQGKRLGLRYINKIKLNDNNYFEWEEYLNKNLLAIFNIPDSGEKKNISRAFHNLIINYDSFNLRFQYGMYNPDFPASIKQKLFILDFDAACSELILIENLEQKLTIFHDKIKELLDRC